MIGAGMGGLVAALDLAASGFEVIVLERGPDPGGKLRELKIAGKRLDAGPTVFTLRRVFEQIFNDAGEDLDAHLGLTPARLLARHAWSAGQRLDLFADVEQSAAAIGTFAGAAEAAHFRKFTARARDIYRTLEGSFMHAARPTPLELVRRVGVSGLSDLWNIQPFATLWQSLSRQFTDPRLRQLFGRYATYCGSSPFQSPATLMLIAHVEQSGVWYVEGGMQRLAEAIAALAIRKGARFRYSSEVREILLERGRVCAVETAQGERIDVAAVICNADNQALSSGLFGAAVQSSVAPIAPQARSLSALTWNLVATTQGFDLARHNVFFSADYAREFDQIFRQRQLPSNPTVYVCAQDRDDAAPPQPHAAAQRLLCLVNAPAIGDAHSFEAAEIEQCESNAFQLLANCGLSVQREPQHRITTTPNDFHRLFPATGGALYGPSSHGWKTSFIRPGSRSKIPGLYLAGGSTHPGPGLPMAAMSGKLASLALRTDLGSMRLSRTTATPGGT